MTKDGGQITDGGGQTKEKKNSDCRFSIAEFWIPAFAGMTKKSARAGCPCYKTNPSKMSRVNKFLYLRRGFSSILHNPGRLR